MKMRLCMSMLMMGALAFSGCNDDDDSIQVSAEFQSAFQALYPDVTQVSWEREAGYYYVADFWNGEMNAEAEAWFDEMARWQMTITEINYNGLPEAVKEAHAAGEYSTWRVDDVDVVERPEMETVYVLDVESGNLEYDLYYTGDGTLVKTVVDNGNNDPVNYIPGNVSSTINEFIAATYPSARIVEIDRKNTAIEVDIIDGNVHREVVFSLTAEWKYTQTEFRMADLPQTVIKAFIESQYNRYSVDDIDFYNTPDGDFYIFELESEPDDMYIKIFPDGRIESVGSNTVA